MKAYDWQAESPDLDREAPTEEGTMRTAIYECGACNAHFSAWGPHCSLCGLEPPEHDCVDCPGWPADFTLELDRKTR